MESPGIPGRFNSIQLGFRVGVGPKGVVPKGYVPNPDRREARSYAKSGCAKQLFEKIVSFRPNSAFAELRGADLDHERMNGTARYSITKRIDPRRLIHEIY